MRLKMDYALLCVLIFALPVVSGGGEQENPAKRNCVATDRFIPARAGLEPANGFPTQAFRDPRGQEPRCCFLSLDDSQEVYRRALLDAVSPDERLRVLPISGRNRLRNFLRPLCVREKKIPEKAEWVLDAPALNNDFYLHLLAWSSQDQLAVALGNTLYVQDRQTGAIRQFVYQQEEGYPTSLAFSQDGILLVVGTSKGVVNLFEVGNSRTIRKIRDIRMALSRIAVLSFSGAILAAGDQDANIYILDLRQQHLPVKVLRRHRAEVCGLLYHPDGNNLASGGNDNQLCVWDMRKPEKPYLYSDAHHAAVKALAWSPARSCMLASGGGSADRCIRLWDIGSRVQIECWDTGSQISDLVFNKEGTELVSAHGYHESALCVWNTSRSVRVGKILGHLGRVLALARSPDGSGVCSLGADETLRFWSLWNAEKPRQAGVSLLDASFPRIR